MVDSHTRRRRRDDDVRALLCSTHPCSSSSPLPRAELASLAEAMVRLQGLKQRVSLATESVSGPVDVLLISKAEGLVWVKRKGGEGA